MSELNILTVCINELRPLPVFPYNSERLYTMGGYSVLCYCWIHKLLGTFLEWMLKGYSLERFMVLFLSYQNFGPTCSRDRAYCKRFWTLLAILNMVRHSMIQECGTILYAWWYSIQHIAKFFLLLFVSFRTNLSIKIKSLESLQPFCYSVKTPLLSSDSYILSEIIPDMQWADNCLKYYVY